MAKRIINWTVDGNLLRLHIGNVKTPPVGEFDIALLPPEIRTKLLYYGIKQKLADSVSGKKAGKDKLVGIDECWIRLMDGIFNKGKAPSGPTTSLTKIVNNLLSLPPEQLVKAWDGLTLSLDADELVKVKTAFAEALGDEPEDEEGDDVE